MYFILELNLAVLLMFLFLRLLIAHLYLHIQPTALTDNLLQNLHHFFFLLPGDHGILKGKLHFVIFWKFHLRHTEHIVF